jgi:taurine-pyruvate aminotransferase
MDDGLQLILHRTSREQIEKGITTIVKGQGTYIFDQGGKSYLDLVSGVTRPVHVGYGRREIAQAVYDQICELCYFTPMQFANNPGQALEFAPPLIIKKDDIDHAVRILDECITEEERDIGSVR